MTDDFTVLWQNNDRACALFYDLLERVEKNAYDDDFLTQLAVYREHDGDEAHADIFAAQYLIHHDDAEGALLCGERAFRRRPISHALWSVLARAYTAVGCYADALVMQGYLSNFYNVPIALDVPPEVLNEDTLKRLSLAMGKANYAPFTVARMRYDVEHGLSERPTAFADEFLPVSPHITPPYYVGVYTEQELHGNKAWLIATIKNAPDFVNYVGGDFTFDLIRGQRAPGTAHIEIAEGQRIVLPILGTTRAQLLNVRTDTVNDSTWLNPGTPNFFRLDETTDFSSGDDFIVGHPIRPGHAPKRRPLVLNILVDALPWTILRERFAEEMPQTHRFFAKGLIFDRHFSAAEYTYTSLPTIETGMYPHHNQVILERAAIELNPEYITLSERLRDLGYRTAYLMSGGDNVYNGVTRGHDRLIISPYRLEAYEGVERTIRDLEGFRDVDNFLALHFMDIHPWSSELFQVTGSVQARLPLVGRLAGPEEKVPSPYLRPSALNQAAFWQGVHDLDRALGTLFTYLEEHYAPEEYLVNLYSDHGVPIFRAEHCIVDAHMTGAAWMMRGAGVPEGVIAEELTSAVDLYPALAHLLGFPVGDNVDGVLPKIFGGPGREIAFSNSLFALKHYYLAARSDTHSLFLETEDSVSFDGTVDAAKAKVTIYPRAHEMEAEHEVDTPDLRAFFYPRVRAFLRGIANNGEAFPPPKEI